MNTPESQFGHERVIETFEDIVLGHIAKKRYEKSTEKDFIPEKVVLVTKISWLCHNCHFLVHHYEEQREKFMVSIA